MRLRLGRPAVMLAIASITLAAGIAVSQPAGSVQADMAGYGQTSTVGALFAMSPSGELLTHFCTASVVDSATGDLILTAAHCVAGRTAGGMAFVPGYSRGKEPYGVWTVRQVIEDQNWTSSSDPDDDFAFLVVHTAGSKSSVQALTGGEAIGIDVPAGRPVKVAGYPNALNGLISCENTTLAFSLTQYQFDCAGFTDGTSGSPLLAAVGPHDGVDTVIGVIGGYQQGGNTSSVSYAAKFSTRLSALYRTALAAARR